jgi:hypothetical protein
MEQLITPNPHIPCRPGWCLAYVNEAFGVPKKYGGATAAWYGSATKHADRNFPAGCWVPVWYALANEPNGHVVLLAPDGSCYSTSDPSTTPHHHPSLADLEWYYAHYGMPLTYRGWTEDVEDTPVVTSGGLSAQGDITLVQEDDMPITQDDANLIADTLLGRQWQNKPNAVLGELLNEYRGQHLTVVKEVQEVPTEVLTYTVDGVAGDHLNLDQFLREYRSHVIQDQAASAAIIAAKAAAGGASIEEIQKAVHDGLAAGIKVEATVRVGEQ